MTTHERLDRLHDALESQGADRLRLELVRRARNFKRSWVEMAEALTRVRAAQVYLEWGYPDFETYCHSELMLTKGTVDKLTGSYAATYGIFAVVPLIGVTALGFALRRKAQEA